MLVIPYVLATLIALGGSIQRIQFDEKVRVSHQLKPGDSEARVLEVLGNPRERRRGGFFSFGTGQLRWIYGTDIDLGEIINPNLPFPNLVPIRLRIFGPCDDDLVVNWDDHGEVASIDHP